jgi:CubicO group peptidase (beta-lactamase class C family)
MTKPITAVATMILVEECKLRLDEPVDALLPELANRRVVKRLAGPTVPANRPITVRDLLTFRMGMGLVIAPPNAYPIQKAMIEHKVAAGPFLSTAPGPDAWIRRLETLPPMHQPGEKWMYHTGSEVLDVLIARLGPAAPGEDSACRSSPGVRTCRQAPDGSAGTAGMALPGLRTPWRVWSRS